MACREYRDAQVMVVGSSHARMGVASPDLADQLSAQMGRPIGVFNLGAPGVGARNARVRTRVLLNETRPRLLIYAVSSGDFDPADGKSAKIFFRAHASAKDMFTIGWPPRSYQDAENLVYGLFRPGQLPFQWLSQRVGNYRRMRRKIAKFAGWNPSRRRVGGRNDTDHRDLPDQSVGHSHLLAMKQMAQERDCRLLVVRLPYHGQAPYRKYNAPAMEKFTVELQRYCKQEAIPLINLQSPDTPLEPADFNEDGVHIINSGARKLAVHMAPMLVRFLGARVEDGKGL